MSTNYSKVPVLLAVVAALAFACDASAPAAGAGAADAAPHEDRGGNCASCHMPDYRDVRNPPHVDVKPTTCAVCHAQDGWRPSVLHHDWWPLTGAHAKADCLYCHQGKPPLFVGTPKECVKCHLPEFDKSTYPEHSTFGTKCADCHTTIAFKPATKIPPPTPLPMPVATVAPLTTKPGTKPPKAVPGQRPVGPVVPVPPPPPPRPTTPPPRPPDVLSRPSQRR